MDENTWPIKEIAEEVDKLIKYTLEMRAVTGYKNKEPLNVQMLSLWSNSVLKRR